MRSMAMVSALALVAFLAVCSADPLNLACGSCPTPRTPRTPNTPVTVPPVTLPPVTVPPVTVPPVTLPPVVRVPPVTLPPVVRVPPVTLPPVTGLPPVVRVPPVTGGSPPSSRQGGCPSPPATTGSSTCPMLKLGVCLDILGETIQIGDPAVECCAPLNGLTSVDAALCLCTTITAKLLDMNIVLPVALQFLASTCGKSIPPGYTCP